MEGAVVGAEAAAERGSAFDDQDVWYIAETIPEGMTAAVAVLEHRWAIPLRDAITDAGGVALADRWVHPAGPARDRRGDRLGPRSLTNVVRSRGGRDSCPGRPRGPGRPSDGLGPTVRLTKADRQAPDGSKTAISPTDSSPNGDPS